MKKFQLKQIDELNIKIKILKDAIEANSLSDKIDILKKLYTEDGLKSFLNSSIMKNINCFESLAKEIKDRKPEILI